MVQDTFFRLMAQPREAVNGHAVEWLFTVLRHRALIECLPPDQPEVVRLKFQNGFSYEEISRITGLAVPVIFNLND